MNDKNHKGSWAMHSPQRRKMQMLKYCIKRSQASLSLGKTRMINYIYTMEMGVITCLSPKLKGGLAKLLLNLGWNVDG